MRFAILLSAVVLALAASAANAQDDFFAPHPLPLQGGAGIYKGLCQDCHMPDARGGKIGPIGYPALAANPKLEIPGYPVSVILHGQKAMPAFGLSLTDQQVADVVNYIRGHFGNSYKDKVVPGDVKAAR